MISVEQLEVRYGAMAPALKSTNLRFERGTITVLLGASGAGKSTLLRALNGLVTPSLGRVVVDETGDISLAGNLIRHRRRTGMIFQQHHLIGRMSALGNVLLGRLGHLPTYRALLPYRIRDKHLALEALERVHLLDHALRRADQMSGGQQQRVGIARALVQVPEIVLADEPVASLDPLTAERVLNLLHRICKADRLTTIISLHQLSLARRFADRVIGLSNGRVVFDGLPETLTREAESQIYGASGHRSENEPVDDVFLHQAKEAYS